MWVANFFSCLNDKKSSLDIPNISTGIVPDVFKVLKVTPVFKSGALPDPRNYRPIATLSLFNKA